MIEIIEIDGYLNTLKPMSPTSGGISARTYLATVQWPDGQVIDSYVKLFPADVRTKELINESFGFLLAGTVNLPQSNRAALIKLDVSEFSIDTSNDSFASDNGFVYGWVTSSLGGDNLRKTFFKNYPDHTTSDEAQKLMIFLNNWSHFPSLIAFDDWIGNIDRNIGNLIFINKNNVAIIDHGRLFGVENWLIQSINADLDCDNKMLNIFKDSHHGATIHPSRCKPILDSAIYQQTSYTNALVQVREEIIKIDSIIDSKLSKNINHFFDYFDRRFANIASRLPLALAA
ncbi:hypothetical protein [Acinetobacter guillouiae]|uniref:hypothetical protein n=1 Tax=Acinetobacter guillouiae TaxID=106649 RepID=UPI002091B815|nr:hypothetical protein [Acinetobacter guillouiae]